MPYQPKPKFDTSNIPPNVLALAKRYRHPPRGQCACSDFTFLNTNGKYVCPNCAPKARHLINDKMKSFGIAGSNYHRVTGKYVNPNSIDEYTTARDSVKSNVARELNRYGKY